MSPSLIDIAKKITKPKKQLPSNKTDTVCTYHDVPPQDSRIGWPSTRGSDHGGNIPSPFSPRKDGGGGGKGIDILNLSTDEVMKDVHC